MSRPWPGPPPPRAFPRPASIGIRSALGAGVGRDAAPVRSAVLGAVLAVVVVVASFTFGASLNSLVSQPKLYGWNWNYALLAGFSAAEDLPAAQTAALLATRPGRGPLERRVLRERASSTGSRCPSWPSARMPPCDPTPFSGHALQSDHQVVLGPATLAALHKHIGDTVMANTGRKSPVRLRIVGTATLPTIGGSGDPELQMGTGAVLATSLFTAAALNQQGSPIPGPNAVFVTVRPGVSPRGGPALAQSDRRGSEPALGRGGSGQRGGVRPPPGRDRRLPRRRVDSFDPGRDPGGRGHGGAGAHPGRLGPASATGVRAAQGSRLHPAAAGDDGGVAVLGVRRRRGHLRRAPGHRPRAVALDLCSPGGSTPSPNPPCRS